MLQRFTQRGRETVGLAEAEARDLRFSHVGTETLLLGVLRGGGITAEVLGSFDVTLDLARTHVRRCVSSRDDAPGSGPIPFTPRAKSVLESALRESLKRGEFRVGPEHILLGMARINEGVAIRVLQEFDVDAETLRTGVIRRFPVRPPTPGIIAH